MKNQGETRLWSLIPGSHKWYGGHLRKNYTWYFLVITSHTLMHSWYKFMKPEFLGYISNNHPIEIILLVLNDLLYIDFRSYYIYKQNNKFCSHLLSFMNKLKSKGDFYMTWLRYNWSYPNPLSKGSKPPSSWYLSTTNPTYQWQHLIFSSHKPTNLLLLTLIKQNVH